MKQFLLIFMLGAGSVASAQSVPPLGTAQTFAVLSASTVTNTGPTAVAGDVGVSPGTSMTGFPPGTVSGGALHSGDAIAVAAHVDAQTAYNDLLTEPCGTNLSGNILGTSPAAVTLSPGVYCFNSSAQLTANLTLSGNGIYIFQIGSTLTTASNSSVILSQGAMAKNVFWQVGSSATFGTDTVFVGTVLAAVSDTVTNGTSVVGRIFALAGAVTLDTNVITVAASGVGRWEIVHTSGDNSAQSALYPGGFSTFLTEDGSGYTYGTFTNSICVIDSESYNLVPSWSVSGGNVFQITITVNNLGLGPNFAMIYNGVFNPHTPIPGDTSVSIPTIAGTYYAVGDVSACSLATQSAPGNFVATFIPTISSGSASGSLDGFSADNGSAFDAPVNATIAFAAPPAPGQVAGIVSLASNPTSQRIPCFASTSGVVNPLTIDANSSSQSGTSEYLFAEGLDPQGVPTTLFLNGYSVNLYTGGNADPNASQISATEWAVAAAIGEDNPSAGVAGVSNDGTNRVMVYFYGVIGGACDNAGGVDSPFLFISGAPFTRRPSKSRHRRTPRKVTRAMLRADDREGRSRRD